MAMTNSFTDRIADRDLCFGLTRFTAGTGDDAESLWRLRIARGFHRDAAIDMDADEKVLTEIMRFCDRALIALRTDGGRLAEAEAA